MHIHEGAWAAEDRVHALVDYTTALQAESSHHPSSTAGGSETQRHHVTQGWGKLKVEFEPKII